MRRTQILRYLALTAALLALTATAPLRAQGDPDDLKRGVARLSLINGDVNVRRGDSGDWVAGVVNAPLLTDDRIATGPSSRTEIEFDANNVLRLGANAEVHLSQLEYGRYQMELARGVATFRMLRTNEVNVEIDTPSISVRPSRQGSVRITVNEAGETEVTPRGGDVEIFSPKGSQWVHNGQTMMARGNASDPEFQIVAAGGMDDWDRWSESRDRAITQSPSSRYVGPGVYGTEDLDGYGNWESVPEYGYVWRPTVAADWAPYHAGRWAWTDWYGWTWVGYEPWGWAPYHYGRWFHHDRFGWCWYPGVVSARHYWSPALVAFFGFGGGGGIGFGFGNVGWVPLAPYELYHPWWGRSWYRSGGYFNHNVNIVNVNVTNVYRNARFNGVSGVALHDFQNGRFNNVGRFNGTQLQNAGVIHGATPFTPGSQNLRFSDRAVGNVPRTNDNARFFTHQTPTPAQRVPFSAQVGRPGGSSVPGGVNAAPQQRAGGGQSTEGFRRFGSTAAPSGGSQNTAPRAASPQQQRPAGGQSTEGFRRFGNPGSSGSAPAGQPRQDQGRTFGSSPSQQPQSQPRQQYQNAPRNDYNNRPNGGNGNYNRQENLRISPPVVRERPSYSAPRPSAPSNSAPRQSAPSYSAPRSNGGGGGGSAPRGNSGGGGGGHQSSGGGSHRGR